MLERHADCWGEEQGAVEESGRSGPVVRVIDEACPIGVQYRSLMQLMVGNAQPVNINVAIGSKLTLLAKENVGS